MEHARDSIKSEMLKNKAAKIADLAVEVVELLKSKDKYKKTTETYNQDSIISSEKGEVYTSGSERARFEIDGKEITIDVHTANNHEHNYQVKHASINVKEKVSLHEFQDIHPKHYKMNYRSDVKGDKKWDSGRVVENNDYPLKGDMSKEANYSFGSYTSKSIADAKNFGFDFQGAKTSTAGGKSFSENNLLYMTKTEKALTQIKKDLSQTQNINMSKNRYGQDTLRFIRG